MPMLSPLSRIRLAWCSSNGGFRLQTVDEPTGRIMADRTWKRGLQQRIQAKEGGESRPATAR